jgi:general stress protein 13
MQVGGIMSKYECGKIVTGCVTGVENYGIFVSLDEYYSGLIHISEISTKFVKDINDYVNIGETIRVKIVEKDEDTCHLKLSIKDIDYRVNSKRRNKIVETEKGFETLSIKLEDWIEEKYSEIEKNENN